MWSPLVLANPKPFSRTLARITRRRRRRRRAITAMNPVVKVKDCDSEAEQRSEACRAGRVEVGRGKGRLREEVLNAAEPSVWQSFELAERFT